MPTFNPLSKDILDDPYEDITNFHYNHENLNRRLNHIEKLMKIVGAMASATEQMGVSQILQIQEKLDGLREGLREVYKEKDRLITIGERIQSDINTPGLEEIETKMCNFDTRLDGITSQVEDAEWSLGPIPSALRDFLNLYDKLDQDLIEINEDLDKIRSNERNVHKNSKLVDVVIQRFEDQQVLFARAVHQADILKLITGPDEIDEKVNNLVQKFRNIQIKLAGEATKANEEHPCSSDTEDGTQIILNHSAAKIPSSVIKPPITSETIGIISASNGQNKSHT